MKNFFLCSPILLYCVISLLYRKISSNLGKKRRKEKKIIEKWDVMLSSRLFFCDQRRSGGGGSQVSARTNRQNRQKMEREKEQEKKRKKQGKDEKFSGLCFFLLFREQAANFSEWRCKKKRRVKVALREKEKEKRTKRNELTTITGGAPPPNTGHFRQWMTVSLTPQV